MVDDEIRDLALKFMEQAQNIGKPFFVWLNPSACTSSRIGTHVSAHRWHSLKA
jgi:arylsulfatase